MSYKIISKNTQRHNQNGTSNNLRCINPLNANPTKWLNKLKQFVGFYRRIVSFSCHNSPHFFYSIQKRHHCNIKTVRNERCFFYFSLYHKGWNSILLWTSGITVSPKTFVSTRHIVFHNYSAGSLFKCPNFEINFKLLFCT